MNLGIASPVSLQLLSNLVDDGMQLPPGYLFAPSADWIQELMRRGHHVTVYTTAREIASPKTFFGDGITIRIAPQRTNGAGRDLFAFERRQLQEMMAEDQCDVIHAHWTYQFALASLSSGIPTLITIHDLPWKVLWNFRDFHRVARLFMAYEVAMRGTHFTAVSEDAANHYRRYFNPRANITVIPNGLPDTIFELGSKPQLGARPEPVFATVLQGWSRRKNAEAALMAFQLTRRQIPNARLLMFGLGYERDGEAHRWAVQHRLEEGVGFVGLLPYGELLNRVKTDVDVLVHPSRDESFSIAALEAMALQKPVIAGIKTDGIREVLEFGRCGALVDITDPAAISAEMIRLIKDNEYSRSLAERGFDRASKLFRLSSVITKYVSVYERIREAERLNCDLYETAR
jgi:glycosyltransferase involved in cell wall biosynthesis